MFCLLDHHFQSGTTLFLFSFSFFFYQRLFQSISLARGVFTLIETCSWRWMWYVAQSVVAFYISIGQASLYCDDVGDFIISLSRDNSTHYWPGWMGLSCCLSTDVVNVWDAVVLGIKIVELLLFRLLLLLIIMFVALQMAVPGGILLISALGRKSLRGLSRQKCAVSVSLFSIDTNCCFPSGEGEVRY